MGSIALLAYVQRICRAELSVDRQSAKPVLGGCANMSYGTALPAYCEHESERGLYQPLQRSLNHFASSPFTWTRNSLPVFTNAPSYRSFGRAFWTGSQKLLRPRFGWLTVFNPQSATMWQASLLARDAVQKIANEGWAMRGHFGHRFLV